MKFQDLPGDVQVIAADTLHSLIHENRFNAEKKSVTQLAQEVRSAFVELYQQGGCEEGKKEPKVKWIIELENDQFIFIKMIDGCTHESYAPVNKDKASVFAVAVIQDFQPPRGLLSSDKPAD